jgi:lipid A 3-O-deacylase
MRAAAIAPALLAVGLCARAGAEPPGGRIVSEAKGGVLAHGLGVFAGGRESGSDINAELLFAPPGLVEAEGVLGRLANPRPHLGLQLNTAGETSQVYAGLTWTLRPLEAPVFLGLSAGGTVHTGDLDEARRQTALGSRVLFRLAAELGWQLTGRLSVSLYYDHESNANLADENEGLNNAGLRVGWRF